MDEAWSKTLEEAGRGEEFCTSSALSACGFSQPIPPPRRGAIVLRKKSVLSRSGASRRFVKGQRPSRSDCMQELFSVVSIVAAPLGLYAGAFFSVVSIVAACLGAA